MPCITSRDIDNQIIPKRDWLRTFWPRRLLKQDFPRYKVCTGKRVLVTPFISSYFHQKVMKKLYDNLKKLYFGLILGLFCPF